MTRSALSRTLRRSYWVLGLVLAISLVTKLIGYEPPQPLAPSTPWFVKYATPVYDYLKDMALVFVTVVAAYLANVFQKRQQFISALKEEWRDILRAKSAAFTYTQLERPTLEQYLAAFCALSETLDNMRTVYGNIGETETDIGLYPFAPLHDMRRALQTLDPRKNPNAPAAERQLVRDAIIQSFYALRESFLDELDLEAPDKPVLIFGGRRIKKSGAPDWARQQQEAQTATYDQLSPPDPRIHTFLTTLYEKEHTTEKPWRQVVPRAGGSAAGGGGAGSPNSAPMT